MKKSTERFGDNLYKVVVLLSGGLDSTVLLSSLVEDGNDCYPITFDYGQRHSKEIVAARNVCEYFGILDKWKLVDLKSLGLLLPSSLTGVDEIPEGHYADESMKSTVVPNRNMILLSIAAGYAQGIGALNIAYAAHAGDHPIYPDCRPEFIQSLRNSIRLGTGWEGQGVELIGPFSHYTKADIVGIGVRMEAPMSLTWSCYKGGEVHCGRCGTCVERREAFKLAGVKDPTRYEG